MSTSSCRNTFLIGKFFHDVKGRMSADVTHLITFFNLNRVINSGSYRNHQFFGSDINDEKKEKISLQFSVIKSL